jgi:hypothetical protein
MTDQKKLPNDDMNNEFDDLVDLEYLEMIELLEKFKEGKLSTDELKKLEFIKKSREYLYGGDA